MEALERLCARTSLHGVYVTPHHQYPTTPVLSAPRRTRLLRLARKYRFAIIEDDYDYELHYSGRPVLPLASRDSAGSVVYLGSLSKVLAPGLRLGFVVAPPPVLERFAGWRELIDRQGDLAVEQAVAELMEDGEVQRHAHRIRRIYGAQRDALLDAVTRDVPMLSVRIPSGGMSVWAEAKGVDVESWKERAAQRSVRIRTAREFAFDGRTRSALRLGFARHTEGELNDAVRRLKQALPRRGYGAPTPSR